MKRYTLEHKLSVAKKWIENTHGSVTKAKFCSDNNTNSRSLDRWVELYDEQVEAVDLKVEPTKPKTSPRNDEYNFHCYGDVINITKSSEDQVLLSRSDNPDLFNLVFDLWRDGKIEDAWKALDMKAKIRQLSDGDVEFIDGYVLYAGHNVNGSFVKRMAEAARVGDEEATLRWLRFTGHLMSQQDQGIVEELADFLQHTGTDIDENGMIVAYKGAREDRWDWFTGKTFYHVPGAILKMPRHKCEFNRDESCSKGIHFGSYDYAHGYGQRVFKVLINPSDVVSIPYCGEGKKGRCCSLTILEEM